MRIKRGTGTAAASRNAIVSGSRNPRRHRPMLSDPARTVVGESDPEPLAAESAAPVDRKHNSHAVRVVEIHSAEGIQRRSSLILFEHLLRRRVSKASG